MKLGTYPQGNKALNSLTPKPNWIPSLNPPGVQPSADRCIFLCPGSTRPDNWFKTFWISNNWTLKTKGNLYTTSLNNQQTQLRISQTMNNMYRIQQNTTANIETYEYFGSVHCDLFGTCPHQNLSSNSWHPPHPVDWTNLQQSFNHHLQLKKKTASTAVLLIYPYPNSAPLFGGSRDSMSLAWSALWLRLVSLGRWNQQHWQQWVTSEDSTHLPLGHVPDEYISHLTQDTLQANL